MRSEKAQNIFIPKSIKSITVIITLEDIENIKTSKNNSKTVWTKSFEHLHVEWLIFLPETGSKLVLFLSVGIKCTCVQILNLQFGIIGSTECIRLEAAKLTSSSSPTLELLQALFTSEASLTFLDLLPPAAERTAQTLHCLPDFYISLISYDCLILSFHWFVSAGYIYIF